MTKKYNVLLFWFVGFDYGEGRTFQKVAEHLAMMKEVARVCIVFPPKRIQEETYAKPIALKRISKKLMIIKENEPVIPLLRFPYRFRTWVNTTIRGNILKSFLWLSGFRAENTILWMFPPHPYMDEITKIIPHTLMVAHIVDNFEKSDDDWLKKYAADQYPRIQRTADMIITGSHYNQSIFSRDRSNCYFFENAVDEFFIADPSELPHRKNGLVPRLGYVGTLSERTDIDLLIYLAQQKPEWSVTLVGHQHIPDHKLESLTALPNVEYRGHILYEEVPRFLQSIDVCLITHKNTEYCQSMSPLKLFQYMASGRPIVATNVDGLDSFKDYISVARTYEEFLQRIELILKTDTIQKSKARIDMAREETWERRIRNMFELVKEQFNEKLYDEVTG